MPSRNGSPLLPLDHHYSFLWLARNGGTDSASSPYTIPSHVAVSTFFFFSVYFRTSPHINVLSKLFVISMSIIVVSTVFSALLPTSANHR